VDHNKYITNSSASPSEPEMQIQVRLTTIITKLATETVVKEKPDHLKTHELDYLNPPIEAAQRRRDCMCETRLLG
jgi:hypothetical protein